MITLYGSLHSRANRCVWMLKEQAIVHSHEPTNFQDGSTHHPAFLRLNPNGRVPVLDDDGFYLFESLAINLYLARKFDGPLSPQNVRDESLAIQWTLWVENEVEKPVLLAAANRIFFTEGCSEAEYDMALRKLARPWSVLDGVLAEQPYILGDRFTVADLNVASVMTLVLAAKMDVTPWPNMAAWLRKCLSRPDAPDWQNVRVSIHRPKTALDTLGMFV